VLTIAALGGCRNQQREQTRVRSEGLELMTLIDVALVLPDGRYASELRGGKASGPAACWPAAVQLSAMAAAARVDDRWTLPLADYAVALDPHLATFNSIDGYAATTQSPDRFYDDNAWVALAMLETHSLTRNPEHLRRARTALDFVLTGEDQTLGGGLYWHEQTRQSKNTCANAPAMVACLRMTRATGDARYTAAALRIYDWLQIRLRDGDGLYMDHVKVTGEIDPTKFSYNSAMVILANCELYDATQQVSYLDDARKTARAAIKRWIDPLSGAIGDDTPFASLLVESLLELYRRDGDRRWRDAARSGVTFLRTKNVDRRGWHPARADDQPKRPIDAVRLIDQSAAARAILIAEIIR